jgi:hypothetical protein
MSWLFNDTSVSFAAFSSDAMKRSSIFLDTQQAQPTAIKRNKVQWDAIKTGRLQGGCGKTVQLAGRRGGLGGVRAVNPSGLLWLNELQLWQPLERR